MRVGVVGFFFFFQAEDGIRDATVTGVQTCALPIYGVELLQPRDGLSQRDHRGKPTTGLESAKIGRAFDERAAERVERARDEYRVVRRESGEGHGAQGGG